MNKTPLKSLEDLRAELIKKKAISLLVALHKSSTYLWKPCLEDTSECIVWDSTEFMESEDEDAELIELPGIQQEYWELLNAIDMSSDELQKLI